MAILDFQKPDQVIISENTETYGVYELQPLEPGYGITIGNALRRVLLSSLEGYAITQFSINNMPHEYTSIDGVVEDIIYIGLNLKQVRLKPNFDNVENESFSIIISGQDEFKAGDLNKILTSFTVINPDLHICTMDPSVELNIEFKIQKGRGYVLAEEPKDPEAPIGTITLDAVFTPIKNVAYYIENFRVGQKTDYEKLILEINTDGTVSPYMALNEAANILLQHIEIFCEKKYSLQNDLDQLDDAKDDDVDENYEQMRKLLQTKLSDLDLSVRAINCLKAADIETLGQLVSYSKNDLLKFRNFGKKSLSEVEEVVKSKNLYFNMDISKYNLDKE
ncbi:MAG: DNA-directed RNA polymerase subunit alpha [Bacteroidales bacterium]